MPFPMTSPPPDLYKLPPAINAWLDLPRADVDDLRAALGKAPPPVIDAAILYPIGCVVAFAIPGPATPGTTFARVLGYHMRIRYADPATGDVHLRVEPLDQEGNGTDQLSCLDLCHVQRILGYRGDLDSMLMECILRPESVAQS